jgi:hypothetical protein
MHHSLTPTRVSPKRRATVASWVEWAMDEREKTRPIPRVVFNHTAEKTEHRSDAIPAFALNDEYVFIVLLLKHAKLQTLLQK